MLVEDNELKNIIGGASGTYINAIIRGVNSFLDVGRSLGTAIRRLIDGSICPL